MVDATHVSYRADDRSYFSILKKEIHNRASEANFSLRKIGEIDIIVSEMTSNLNKHAADGEILLGHVKDDFQEYLEIISIDNGPGMSDPTKMLADGFSTTSTLGHGLGSIKRLSDTFELYTQKGWGTIALSRVYKKSGVTAKLQNIDIKSLVVAKPGETVSGDGTYYKLSENYFKLLVADGLGHGIEANKAVNEAVTAFRSCPFHTPVEILQYLHHAIRKTRGIVATVVVYDIHSKSWNIAGIGNISAKMLGAFNANKSHISYNGILGHNIPGSMKTQSFSLGDFQQIILCSDGLKSRWDQSKYPLIHKYDSSVLAAALYKDYARKTDDMSVVITKIK